MGYISLKVMGIITLIVIVTGNILFLRYQQRELVILRKQNNQLTQQSEMLQTRLLQLKYQAVHLSTTLSEQQIRQQQLENQSEQTRRQLRQAVSQSPCAGQSVPDDVIRLQRKALDRSPRPG